jgi:hypothetical protein
MKYLYQQLDELLNTIKYADVSGDEDADYLENDYFEDVLEVCKEIVELTKRNVTMVVPRSAAEDNDLGFACNPSVVSDKSHVNMYLHHDGYPEYRAIELANWVKHMQEDEGFTKFGDGSRIASHLVKDFHYNSQYLYPSHENIALLMRI